MEDKDLNQTEETSSASGFSKVMKMLGKYFKNLFNDFITSFKYNNMKLPGLLICVPGVFLGFFLVFHAPVVKGITYQSLIDPSGYYKGISFDPTAILLFVLVLSGILNIFTGVTLMNKKNLGSVIKALITSLIVTISGIVYIVFLLIFMSGLNAGQINTGGAMSVDLNFIMSIASVVISIVCSIAGLVLGFIFYDRTYEKVDR